MVLNQNAHIITTAWDDLEGAQILAAMENVTNLELEMLAEQAEKNMLHMNIITMSMMESVAVNITSMNTITTMSMTRSAAVNITSMKNTITTMNMTRSAAVNITSMNTITTMSMMRSAAVSITSMNTITTMSMMESAAVNITSINIIITIMQMKCLQAGVLRHLTSMKNRIRRDIK